MIILDTNYILRFLLKDNENMYEISKEIISNNSCFIESEVLAEVVFVLLKVYNVSKFDIQTTLEEFISYNNIALKDKKTMVNALKIFNEKNLDFVDAILCAKSKKYIVKTFDKKLNKCIKSQNN